jgi:hypothetical protein
MHTITFIYKIDKTQQTYHGKFLFEDIPENHEGLDTIIKPKLLYGLNKYRTLNDKKKLKQSVFIGVLSYSSGWIDFSTEREVKCFDFVYAKGNRSCNGFGSHFLERLEC